MFFTVSVQVAAFVPLSAHAFVTVRSGAGGGGGGGTVIEEQMFVLLAGCGSSGFGPLPCVTVAQFVSEPPDPKPNPKK